MRHVVHCSGYSLAERSGVRPIVTNQQGLEVKGKFFDWDIVCLGHPDLGIYGRIPMAVHLAESLRAECLIWSTGATYLSGVSEAEFMMNTGHDYLTRKRQPAGWLQSVSVIERDSTNTFSSLRSAARIVRERFATAHIMLHLITSQNHAPRVARDAAIAFDGDRSIILSVVPAHTSYGGKSPSQVAVQDLSSEPGGG